jgi:hypothetical protein
MNNKKDKSLNDDLNKALQTMINKLRINTNGDILINRYGNKSIICKIIN